MEWQAPQQMAPIRSPPRDAYAPFVEFTSKKGGTMLPVENQVSQYQNVSQYLFS